MKTNSPPPVIAVGTAMTGVIQITNATNNSTYWDLQSNSNTTISKKRGAINKILPLLYASNKVPMYIDASSGNVSIAIAVQQVSVTSFL